MAKRLILFSLRLLLLVVVADILSVFFTSFTGFWLLLTNIILTGALLVLTWLDSSNYGQKDVKSDKMIRHRIEESGYQPVGEEGRMYKPWLGFVAGLITQSPIIIFILATVATQAVKGQLIYIFTQLSGLYFLGIINSISDTSVLPFFIPVALFVLAAGFGYMNGPAQQKRLETIIERNKAKKAKRVQDDIKAKKKGNKRK